MGQAEWQAALSEALNEPRPCFMCAETLPWRRHRRFIAELLTARGHRVVHLIRPARGGRTASRTTQRFARDGSFSAESRLHSPVSGNE